MPILLHEHLPIHPVPRITTRILVDSSRGARATTIWEQWIDRDGFIPPHYHEVEETLVLLEGTLEVTLGEETTTVRAPATIFVPPNQIHAVRPAGDAAHLLAMFPAADPKIFAPDGRPRPMPWEDR